MADADWLHWGHDASAVPILSPVQRSEAAEAETHGSVKKEEEEGHTLSWDMLLATPDLLASQSCNGDLFVPRTPEEEGGEEKWGLELDERKGRVGWWNDGGGKKSTGGLADFV